MDFNFIREQKEEIEKIKIDETFCTLVTVGGKFLEKNKYKKVLKKIDEIRKIIRMCLNYLIYLPLSLYSYERI